MDSPAQGVKVVRCRDLMGPRFTGQERAAQWLQYAFTRSGISQSQLARRTGTSRQFISRLLKYRSNMTVRMLFLLIESCGFEVVDSVTATGLRVELRSKPPSTVSS